MRDLDKYKLSMQGIPARLEKAISRGVLQGEFPDISSASEIFGNWDHYEDRVLRAKDGRLLVTCTTNMEDVTPGMIDWWFGWHLTDSARYRLWHPEAHVRASVKQDRSAWSDHREKYLGNESYVDEYIGARLMRLTIAFFEPAKIGLEHYMGKGAAVICARTSDRALKSEAGGLVHLVVPMQGGSQMRSVFWLGELNLRWPLVGALLGRVLNTKPFRSLAVPDRMGTDLLRHCAEEMNHLPLFLPSLYRDMTQ